VTLPEGVTAARLRTGNVRRKGLSTPFAQATFGRWAWQDRADLFWSPRHHLPAGLGDMPSALTIHDLVWRKAPQTMMRLGWLIERMLMPASLRRANVVLVPSRSTADDIADEFPDCAPKVRITPLASTLRRPPAGGTSHTPSRAYMLFVGTLEPRKNLCAIIDAFLEVTRGGQATHDLVIAGGSGWKNRDILGRLRDPHTARRAFYVGTPSDDCLMRLYEGADFVVAPSVYEGFGLQIAEALEFGKPVITSNLSSMPEVAGDAGILVDPRSVSEIADAMTRLMTDREEHSTLQARALARSKHFSWTQSAAATLAALERAAA
jgi:glycosyltransferase involved in cell wall biosynthesis